MDVIETSAGPSGRSLLPDRRDALYVLAGAAVGVLGTEVFRSPRADFEPKVALGDLIEHGSALNARTVSVTARIVPIDRFPKRADEPAPAPAQRDIPPSKLDMDLYRAIDPGTGRPVPGIWVIDPQRILANLSKEDALTMRINLQFDRKKAEATLKVLEAKRESEPEPADP